MALLRANNTFFVSSSRKVEAGAIVDSSDPVVKGREGLFTPVEAVAEARVEQATAAPGEKRSRRPRAHKAD